jgi:hypothetical protein
MAGAIDRSAETNIARCRFGSDTDVEARTGFSRRTLHKDRHEGRTRFPWYRVGRKILYDLDEVEAVIRGSAGGRVPT